SYDQHNKDADRIYRLVFENYLGQGKFATTPLPVGPAIKEDLPEVAGMTRIAQGLKTLTRFENNRFFETLTFVDTDLAEVFTLDFLQSDPQTALNEPNSLLISESYAKKYFGDTDPIGKTLEIGTSGALNSTVTGVFEDLPENATVQFNLALPFSTFEKVYGPADLWQQMPGNYTYIRLADQSSLTALNEKLPAFTESHMADQMEDWRQNYQLSVQPLLNIHLHSDYGRESSNGNVKTLYLLAMIAFLVLIIAVINYVNYSTARFSQRAREVSIRKVVGAGRKSLVIQFIGEALLTTTLAGIVAVMLAQGVLPGFNLISGKTFSPADLYQPWFFAAALGTVLLVGLAAGAFPAFFLSGFHPMDAIKGKFREMSMAGFSRKGLVVAQFTASVTLVVATMIVWRQMDFVRSQIRPESSEQVAVFQVNGKLSEQFSTLQQELMQIAGVEAVAGGSNIATFTGDSWPVTRQANGPRVQTENYAIQGDFVSTMGYELIAGRNLDPNLQSDIDGAYILNETAVKSLGFASPQAALEEQLLFGGDELKKGTIVGVIRDFHFASFHEKVEPALLQFAPYDWMRSQFVAVRFQPERVTQLREAVSEIVNSLAPNWHAELHYLDENFMQLHEKDVQQGRIFGAFALLAIFISCLGLIGLVTFAAERRAKEIGIRKVLGASVASIFKLLSSDFLRLVFIAFLIAVPISWYAMNNWLEGFTYRIDISAGVYIWAGIGALGIALFAMSWQSLKAALANPVESLRSE
ncbi:MAG: ABC transporter permease, partial [Lewinella sp.]|nr:ABC transporter permease [Lewinella sp.]